MLVEQNGIQSKWQTCFFGFDILHIEAKSLTEMVFYSYLINKLHFIYAELAVYLNQNMDPLEAITKKNGHNVAACNTHNGFFNPYVG